jgi:predicted nucleotidyltransferase
MPKTGFLLKQYALRLKNHHALVDKGERTLKDEKFVAMKEDYLNRIKG